MNNYPSKEQVREWLKQRRASPEPLPDRAQIRCQLGWQTSEALLNRAAVHAATNTNFADARI